MTNVLPVCWTFQSGRPKTGDSKVARTRRLESLRYEPVPVHGPNAFGKTKGGSFHEPWLVWRSAFRRLKRLGPAEAGTPNGQCFHGPNTRHEIREGPP